MKMENMMKQKIGESLQTVLYTAHHAISSWAEHEKASAMVWANTPEIREATIGLIETTREKKELINSPFQKTFRSRLVPLLSVNSYQGYFIIDRDNMSLASSRDENIGSENLLVKQKPFLDKLWSGSSALSLPLESDVFLPDKHGVMQGSLPTMFVGAPVINDDEVIAIFVFRINPLNDFTSIMQQGSLGKSGETYAFSREGLMVSQSRFVNQLPNINLIDESSTDKYHVVELRDPGVNLLQGEVSVLPRVEQPLTHMVQQAILRGDGVNLKGYRDYRGVTVLGAWLWDEDLQLGITIEIDADEAYEAVRYNTNIILILIVVSVLLLVLLMLVYLFSQKRLVKSNQELMSIIKNSPVAMVLTDSGGNIDFFNRSFIEQFGWTSDDVRTPDEWWQAAYPDASYRQKVQKDWGAAIKVAQEANCEIAPQFWKLVCKSGDVKDVEFRMISLNDSISIIVMHDLSDIRRSEQQRQQMQSKLLKGEKTEAIGQLSAGVAHNFNNMLAAIVGYTGLAKKNASSLEDDNLDKILSEILKSSLRARDLVEQVQAYSRTRYLDKKLYKLQDVVTNSMSLLMAALSSNVKINTQLDDAPAVLADENQLQQVIVNLVRNSSDAINGSGEVDIGVRHERVKGLLCSSCYEALDGEYVILDIRDKGEGIDDTILDQIFNPFFTTREIGKGTGMGLSVVHGIVHDLDGHIHVESQLGEGAIFSLYIPVAGKQ